MTNHQVMRGDGFAGNEPSRIDIDLRHLHQEHLARRWNLSPRTLERWRWLKQGPAYLKVGGRVAYRLEDIEAFENGQLRPGNIKDVQEDETIGPRQRRQDVVLGKWR